MKKYLFFMILIALTGLCGCDSDEPVTDVEAEAELSLDEQYYLSESDNHRTFTVTANKAWAISGAGEHDWLSVEPCAGGAGTHTVTIQSKCNTTYSFRKASLLFSCGLLKKEFTVTQVQNDALILSAPSVEMSSDGGEFEVSIKSNIDFTVEISSGNDWITQMPDSRETRALDNHTLRFKVSEYYATDADREGTVTIKAADASKSQNITVTQTLLSGSLPNLIVEKTASAQTVLAALTHQPDTVTVLNVIGKVDSLDLLYLSALTSLTELRMGRSEMPVSPESGKVRFPAKAFYSHPTLKSITFPRNLEVLGAQALQNCKALNCQPEFPESIVEIETKAFAGSAIKGSLLLPQNLTTMGANAFDGCTQLNGALVLPAGLTEIPACAFNSCSALIGELVLPETVSAIGDKAFNNCLSFKGELLIPVSVNSLGSAAFQNCAGLTSLKIDAALTEIPESLCNGCVAIEAVQLPSSVLNIGSSAFGGCKGLESVNFSEKLTEIGEQAFSACTALTALVLPAELQTIGNSAFRGCTGLQAITFGKKLQTIDQHAFNGCAGITDLNLPEGLQSIGPCAFMGVSITELVVPKGVEILNGFTGCLLLESVTVSETVTEIGATAFQNCSKLSNITFEGNKLTTFGDACFGYCGFTTFECPESVTTFGKDIFTACSQLTSVKFPASLKNYPDAALSQTAVTKFEFPEGVTSVGTSFFSMCVELQEVVLPESLKTLPNMFLYYCPKLSNLKVLSDTPPTMQPYSILLASPELVVSVPASSLEAYQGANYWKNFTIQAIN